MEPLHNARIKRYPDGSAELLIGSRPFGGGNISRPPACMDDEKPPFLPMLESPEERLEREYASLERDAIALEDRADSQSANAAACRAVAVRRSVRRARKAVRDLARSNDWAYFVTLTLDPEKVDRYSFDAVWKHLRHWLGNAVRRKGLAYVLVPEHHKDGALHFHGFFNAALEAVDSGTLSVPGRKAPVKARSEAHREALERMGGRTVYNLPDWGWGFSTAIHLYGEREAAISYVCKYIGKEMDGPAGEPMAAPVKTGGRWYYSGGALQRPAVEWFDTDVREWEDYPGWFQPEEYPCASFLMLRVTAEGEVLAPYFKNAVDGTDVLNETSVLEKGNAVGVEGDRDRPPEEAVTVGPGPSAGRADGQSVRRRDRESSAVVRDGFGAALSASRPAHTPPNFPKLTFLGLSNSPAPPGAQPPQRGRAQNDQ